MGTMLAGQGVDALYASLEHPDLFSIGLNCSTGPEFMTDHLRTLAESPRASCRCPNAGLPDEHGIRTARPRAQDAAFRRPGLAQRDRWLLRHHRGTPRARRAGRRQGPARAAAPRPSSVAIDAFYRRRQSPGDRRRAHQRDRLAPVQGPHRRREVRGGHRDRPRPGEGAAPRSSTSAWPTRTATRSWTSTASWTSSPQGQGPADDRLDRRAGDRARAPELPGQGHHQLHQPGGRRGALRARRAAAQAPTAPRSWSAASTRTSSRAWR